MDTVMHALGVPLNALIEYCYRFLGSYFWAIVVFTFFTKIILLPISLWVQKKSVQMVAMMPELNRIKIQFFGDKETIGEKTQELYKEKKYHPIANTIPMIVQLVLLMGVIEAVKQLFAGTDHLLTWIPSEKGGLTLLAPVLAGLAALLLSLAMNRWNPLQKEQSKMEQLSTGAFSVLISLSLGGFVSLGTVVYWIFSNLFSIPQQLLLNVLVNPKKSVDYELLAASREKLQKMESLGNKVSPEDKKREKADYKRFFSVANKHIVFYSEGSGFYKYFEGLIGELLNRSNLIIHYVTNDPKDQIFEIAQNQPRIRPYYIGEKRIITLMMKMDADIVVMTTPDLNTYHIKRSYVRDDIEYIFVNHGMGSVNVEFRKGALDHFDTIYLDNAYMGEEIRGWEKANHLPEKRFVEYGYPLMDQLLCEYEQLLKELDGQPVGEKKKIVVAPSWQTDNIMDLCIDPVLSGLSGRGYEIVVRPHPQYVRHHQADMELLKERYRDHGDISFDSTFSSFRDIYTADLLITDWSAVGLEYAFTTCRPVLYIHTPRKIMNPDYKLAGIEGYSVVIRDQVGVDLPVEELDRIGKTAQELMDSAPQYALRLSKLRQEERYHFRSAAQAGAHDIIARLKERSKNKK